MSAAWIKAGAVLALAAMVPGAAAYGQSCPAFGAAMPNYTALPGGVDPTTGAYTPSVANGGITASGANTDANLPTPPIPPVNGADANLPTPPLPPATVPTAPTTVPADNTLPDNNVPVDPVANPSTG